MEKLIAEFPQNITEALKIAASTTLALPINEIRNIVVCGMGGSCIGGKIIGQVFSDELKIPFTTVHDYQIPAFVNHHTLFIASSYSGNTEETIEATTSALKSNAHVVAICSGGKLQELAKTSNFDTIIVPGGNPPRSALAFSLVQLTKILVDFKLINAKALNLFNVSAKNISNQVGDIQSKGKEVAKYIGNKTPIFYSSSNFEGLAIRARQQLNENAKTLCWHHVIPEMNHNELVGWSGGDENYRPVLIQNKNINERNLFRFNISKKVMTEKCGETYTVKTLGNSVLEETLYGIHLLDWASLYLSQFKNEDPIAIPVIDYLKGELSKF